MQRQYFLQSTLWIALCFTPIILCRAIEKNGKALYVTFEYPTKHHIYSFPLKQDATVKQFKSTMREKINNSHDPYTLTLICKGKKKKDHMRLSNMGIAASSKMVLQLKKRKKLPF